MSFDPNELMSMFAITLISPTSLSNGKFLGRAIPIIVPFTMFENLFQDCDTVLKKSIMFLKIIYYLVKFIRNQEDSHGSASHDFFFFLPKWPGWWLGADKHLNEDGEIKCTKANPHF